MLFAHLVVNAVIAAFEQGPERFNAVRMHVAPDVFAVAMVHNRMANALDATVGAVLVGVERRTLGDGFTDGLLQAVTVSAGNHGGADFAIAGLGPKDDCLAHSTPARVHPLAGVLILFFAADVGFVGLNAPVKLPLVLVVGLADAMGHKPRRFLRDAKVLGELNRGNTLARCGKQIDRHKPLTEGQFAFAKDGVRADCEVLLASGATVTLAVGKEVNFAMAAMGAVFAMGKPGGGKVGDAGCLIAEVIREVGEGFELE